MSKYSDWLNGSQNYNPQDGKIEYYEDTHKSGIYSGMGASGMSPQPQQGQYTQGPPLGYNQQSQGQSLQNQPLQSQSPMGQNMPFGASGGFNGGMPLPNKSQAVIPRQYQNVVVYDPKTPEDVQTLIDYLKRREPAVINLDKLDQQSAQRILDFVSGAMYALNGSIHRIAGNIFLLSPEGVEIKTPYEI